MEISETQARKQTAARVQVFKLDNGLTVILKEVHSVPVTSLWVAYRVGSRNERSGQTGISHWVEHMMFKGTPDYPAGMLDKLVDRAGGQWNAFTSTDCTMYYFTMPADKIELAAAAEADRMRNATFDTAETESERTVITSERRDNENRPMFWLMEEMRAAAFRVHGYHHVVIGDMVDLQRMTRDELYTHYQQHYTPSNATVVVVGAFETDDMLKMIEKHFGAVPAMDAPDLFTREEPPQFGERRVTVERPGTTAFLSVAHRAPTATADDWFALDVMDSILTGAGGGIDQKTSRLYRALVKTGVAAGVNGGLSESIDPYLYNVTVTLNDGRTPAEAEEILLSQFDTIGQQGVTDYELERAKKQARAAFAYATESVTNQAYWLAQGAILGDVNWFDTFLSRLEGVTTDDVKRVAQQYLQPQQRIVGWLLPVPEDEADEVDA